MRRTDRTLHRAGWTLARSSFLAAMALVAIVNIIYVWPGKMGAPATKKPITHPGRESRSTPTTRLQTRKQLTESKQSAKSPLPPLTVHLYCGDLASDCQQQRYQGRCSTHLLQGFHTCMEACGVCPALELALRTSMNLTASQLVVVTGSPVAAPCEDDVGDCEQVLPQTAAAASTGPSVASKGAAASFGSGSGRSEAAADCSNIPLPLLGSCKASCGACLPPVGNDVGGRTAGSGQPRSGADPNPDLDPGPSSTDPDLCFDAVDMCAWWAGNDPRICERAAADLQHWWWAAVACRRSCGLCRPKGEGTKAGTTSVGAAREAAGGGGSNAAAAMAAAMRFGVQVGEAADGSPRVAVFEALPNGPDACVDTQAQCASWASSGECDRNPGFMAGACPASCNKCPVVINLPQPLAKVRLNNGLLMPTVGYGCAGLGDATARTARWALEAGYRHLDSAQAREWYREDLVGEALEAFLRGSSTVKRGDVFVTSKLHPRHLGYETTLRQFNQSLRDLRSSYMDLFLLHYAECWGDLCGGDQPRGNFFDSWRALEELYEAGLVRAIGVSNFSPSQLSQLLAAARVRPAVLQVHVDPLGRNEAEQEQCRREGLVLTAYSTLGTQWGGSKNPVLGHPTLQLIGTEAGGRSVAQVALRWALQQGLVVLPRSSNQVRIRQNLELYDWDLSERHMQQIGHLRPAL